MRRGVPNVLVDTRMAFPVNFSTVDVYTLVMHLLSLGVDPSYRFALLNDPKDEIDRGRLFETYARERGINARAFRHFEEALTWLCEEP